MKTIHTLALLLSCAIAYPAAERATKDLKFVNKMTQQYQLLKQAANETDAEERGEDIDKHVNWYWSKNIHTLLDEKEFDAVCPIYELSNGDYIASLFDFDRWAFDVLCQARLRSLNNARPLLQAKIPEFKKRPTSKQRKKLRKQFGYMPPAKQSN